METPGRAHREGGTDAGEEVQQIETKPAENTSLQCCLDLLLKTGFTQVANTWWAVALSRCGFWCIINTYLPSFMMIPFLDQETETGESMSDLPKVTQMEVDGLGDRVAHKT